MASRTPNPLSWRLQPSDGTSYVYWRRGDGKWEISRKPRFRTSRYELRPLDPEGKADFPDSWPLTFTRLKDAKSASLAPRERLLSDMRVEFAYHQRWSVSIRRPRMTEDQFRDWLHALALAEDAERTEVLRRMAA